MPKTLKDNLHLSLSKLSKRQFSPFTSPNPPSSPPKAPSPVVIRNFNSLYDITSDESETTPLESTSISSVDFSTTSESENTPKTPDLSTIFNSRRFFFSSPGRSNSIIDDDPPAHLARTLAVSTYSCDPYVDFRRSMEEMVEANGLDVGNDWDHLHELLLCYLTLNRKHTHKFIVGAFADLLVALMKSDTLREPDAHRQSDVSSDRTPYRPSQKEPGY